MRLASLGAGDFLDEWPGGLDELLVVQQENFFKHQGGLENEKLTCEKLVSPTPPFLGLYGVHLFLVLLFNCLFLVARNEKKTFFWV